MREVTLQEVLDAREARAAAQRRLLAAYGHPLLGFTMNIAGPVKRSALGDLAFRAGLEELRRRLGSALVREELVDAVTGLEAIWVCALPPMEIKAMAMAVETERPVGRLYDLDVIGTDGRKLSRPSPRTCLVCGGPASPCARSRAHGLPAIEAATAALLSGFAADYLADLAVSALVDEVELTPKPGLVDRRNNGAHRDMDLPLFRRSAHSLRPYFHRAVELGLERPDCMPRLQQEGLAAEKTMLAATNGVNTHKGAIYAFGLVLAALGGVLAQGGDVFTIASSLAAEGLPPEEHTHGSQARLRYGAAGARGEAMAGFPHARRACYLLAERDGDALPVLLTLLAEVEDTNLLHRGGPDGLRFVREQAADILSGPAEDYIPRLEALDDACIALGLSPGGCADLLALTLLLYRTRGIWDGGSAAYFTPGRLSPADNFTPHPLR